MEKMLVHAWHPRVDSGVIHRKVLQEGACRIAVRKQVSVANLRIVEGLPSLSAAMHSVAPNLGLHLTHRLM
jgi:hypothetical protein